MTQSSSLTLHIAILCVPMEQFSMLDTVREAVALRFQDVTVTTHIVDDMRRDFEACMDQLADDISKKPEPAKGVSEGC